MGEIGLDYFYDHADRSVQRRVFEAQLALAEELDLPVVIHTREADEDTRAILGNFSGRLRRRGVIHSFTSGRALAEFCLAEGFMLGFNGITTFNPGRQCARGGLPHPRGAAVAGDGFPLPDARALPRQTQCALLPAFSSPRRWLRSRTSRRRPSCSRYTAIAWRCFSRRLTARANSWQAPKLQAIR